MSSASRQLALALFQDYSLVDKGVEDAPSDLGFRRNNALVKIVDLSLAGRRLADVAHFFAAEDTEIHSEYRVDLGLFRWLLGTTSRNARHFSKIIRDAQQAAVTLNEIDVNDESNDFYGSVPLLGSAIVRRGEFIFDLSERLQRAIKNPTTYHFLSLRYVFKSIHSKLLYDRLQEYAEQGGTPWLDIPTLREWLECMNKTYDLFKHFRNKVLDVAIDEIRQVARIEIEMQTLNVPGSKRIGQVRFRITQVHAGSKKEQKLEFIVLRALYETLKTEFALNQDEFNEILTERELYPDEVIQQAIEYTRHAVSLGKVKIRAGGYFMKALREGYVLGTLDKEIHARVANTNAARDQGVKNAAALQLQAQTAASERDQQMAALGWEAFTQLESADQAAAITEFCQLPTAKPLARAVGAEVKELREHLTNPKVHSSFGIFVASRVQQAAKAAKKGSARSGDPLLI